MLSKEQRMKTRAKEFYRMEMKMDKDSDGKIHVTYHAEPIGTYNSYRDATQLAPEAIAELEAGREPDPRLTGDEAKVKALKKAKGKQSASAGKPYKLRHEVRTTSMTGAKTDSVHFR
jgi:hypothetical protein